jgi:hypothetical protein
MKLYANADLHVRVIMTLALLASVVVAAQEVLSLRFPIRDPFHQGEFLAAGMAVLHGAPFEGDPFTIHGAADFFPLLAVSLFGQGPEYLISQTLILYPILSFLSIILVVLAGLRLTRSLGGDYLLLVPFLIFVPFAVGWRDLFFALSLLSFVGLVTQRKDCTGGLAAFAIFGLITAIGTYWSFNRGAAALAAFGPVTLWLAWQDRRYLVSVATALAGFVVIGAAIPGVSLVGYVENFLMLLETASQWSYPGSSTGKAWTIALIGTFSASAAVAAMALRHRGANRERVALTAALLIAGAFYLKISLGRIDEDHVVMGTWLPLLLTCSSARWEKLSFPDTWVKRAILAAVAVLIAMAFAYAFHYKYAPHSMIVVTLLVLAGALASACGRTGAGLGIVVLVLAHAGPAPLIGLKKLVGGEFDWMGSLSALPDNANAVTDSILWAGQRIEQSGAPCVFDLANTGLVNAVANLPSCSRFTYPVYANATFEDMLIADLMAADPTVLVYSSEYWSYRIDGRPMTERFPALDRAILDRFPVEECNLGVCLRSRE